MKLQHQKRYNVFLNKVFSNISSYDDLDRAIREYALSKGESGSEEYNTAAGGAYEVYCECFIKRYSDQISLGIKNIKDTSNNPYETGYDFSFEDNGNQGLIQAKWRNEHSDHSKLTRNDLGTFSSILREKDISQKYSIIFTNLRHGNIYHFSWEGKADKQFRTIDRNAQEHFIRSDLTFWSDLPKIIEDSCKDDMEDPPSNRPHQDKMEIASNRVIDGELQRGRIIAATGSGKSLIEYKNIDRTLYVHKGKLAILVSPTRDLVDQHFCNQYRYKFLSHNDMSVVNFKSGGEPPRDDTKIDFIQTTNEKELRRILNNSVGKIYAKIYIDTTYDSFPKLINVLKDMKIIADLIIFDEFQHLVSQKVNDFGLSDMRQFLLDLPAKRILYYSASQKRGRILSSFDEEVFGPMLCNISYKELRETGYAVPKINIIPIRLSSLRKIPGLNRSLKEEAKLYENIDLEELYAEVAGLMVALEHGLKQNCNINMMTWSKKVAHIEIMSRDKVVNERIKNNKTKLYAVHASIPTNKRNAIYDEVRKEYGNVILQHSCCKEGIDIKGLNCGYVARSLDVIGIQQGPCGRLARITKKDEESFKTGKISLDNPEGWEKYSINVYILIQESKDETFLDLIKDLIRKLQYIGLDENDYKFIDFEEARSGDLTPNFDWMSKIESETNIEESTLEEVIKRAHIELEEEEKRLNLEKYKQHIHNLSMEEMFELARRIIKS